MQTITCKPSGHDDHESAFFHSLLDSVPSLPDGLRIWNGSDPTQRYAIYRNNVMLSLSEALADNFPAIRTQVGVDFFTVLSACYIRHSLPDSPILAFYGADMPAFISTFEPLKNYPWLSDLARMDLAFIRAWHARDVVAPEHLTLPEDIMNRQVWLHPSLQLVCSSWAIYSLWIRDRIQETGKETGYINPAQPQNVMLFRPHLDVMALQLPIASARFVGTLLAGKTLVQAIKEGLDCDVAFNPTSVLRTLVHQGLALDFSHEQNGES